MKIKSQDALWIETIALELRSPLKEFETLDKGLLDAAKALKEIRRRKRSLQE